MANTPENNSSLDYEIDKNNLKIEKSNTENILNHFSPLELIKIICNSNNLSGSEKYFLIHFFTWSIGDFTYQMLSDKLNIDRQKVMRMIKNLESLDIIEVVKIDNAKKIQTLRLNLNKLNSKLSGVYEPLSYQSDTINDTNKKVSYQSDIIKNDDKNLSYQSDTIIKPLSYQSDTIKGLNDVKNDEQNSHIIRNKIDKSILYNNISKHHDERDAFDDLESMSFTPKLNPSLLKPLEQEDNIVKPSVPIEPKSNNKLSDASQIVAMTITKMREAFEAEDLILVDSVLDNQKLLRKSTKIAKTVEEQWTKVLYESYMGKIKHDREEHEIDKESWRESVLVFIDKTTDSNIRNTNYLIKILISKSQQRKRFNSFEGKNKQPVMTNGNSGYKDAGYTTREEFDNIFEDQLSKMESTEPVIMDDYWN